MNILLVFFAIPIAVIILSIIFERYLNCPLSVAGIFFSIFLVIAFALGPIIEYIVATFVYTIISFLVAFLTSYIINRNICNEQSSRSSLCNSCMQNRYR